MPEFNLLNSVPKIVRDVKARLVDKEANRRIALKFDAEYFDGPRARGYGGYHYDGRWVAVARAIVERYELKPGDRVLDIGCAKGFLMKDLRDRVPDLEVWGLDISTYALEHAHPDAARRMVRGSCERLPFADGSFALALSINTIHNLDREGCVAALQEMRRVAPDAGFVQVDAYRDEAELQVFRDWMLTAKTFCTPEGWRTLFAEAGYRGDYFWTILEAESEGVRVSKPG